jgi:hypothetical protein
MVLQWFPREWGQRAWGLQQSSVVLDVKPAIEDVDAQIFLAFHCA